MNAEACKALQESCVAGAVCEDVIIAFVKFVSCNIAQRMVDCSLCSIFCFEASMFVSL